MAIWYIDNLRHSQNIWRNYKKFKNQIEVKGFFNKLARSLIFDKDERAIFKKNHPKIEELYNGLEHMIRKEKIDPTLYTFQADAIIYRFPRLPGRKDLLPSLYLAGIDFCITRDSNEWEALRNIAQVKKLKVESWRFHHASLVRNLEELDSKEILSAILEFSKLHDAFRSGTNNLYLLYKLYPEKVEQYIK
jgi:hypothetical protein